MSKAELSQYATSDSFPVTEPITGCSHDTLSIMASVRGWVGHAYTPVCFSHVSVCVHR